MAVVGTESSSRQARAKTVQSVLKKKGLTPTELDDKAREKELKSFLSGDAWYHGVEVDRLSKQEAEIIAARLVRRTQADTELSDEKAKALEAELMKVFKRRFTLNPDKPERTTRKQREEQLLKVARQHLDEKGIAAFQKANAKRWRPQPGEKYEPGK